MLRNSKAYRLLATLLIICLLALPAPGWYTPIAKAATFAADREVEFQRGGRVGNATYSATNAAINFSGNSDGFTYTKNRDFIIDFAAGDTILYRGDLVEFDLSVANNTLLSELAASGHAQVEVGWGHLEWQEECETRVLGVCVDKDYQGTEAWIDINGSNVIHEEAYHGGVGSRSATRTLTPNMTIKVKVRGIRDKTDAPSGVRGLYFKFSDTTRPVMNSYTFTGSGARWTNPNTGDQELYVKANEDIKLSYNFSEPVRPNTLNNAYYEHFTRHPLFVSEPGTGLPASGEQQYMKNLTYTTAASLKKLNKDIVFQYIGSRYHSSANRGLEPKIIGTGSGAPIDQPLEQKFKEAELTDAAGNAVDMSFPNRASGSSDDYLRAKTVNPFDYDNGGLKVIVDAVPPKYSKTANGVQPEILTGVTLNDNDTIDFTLQMTEEAVVKRGWEVTNTFLLFNNGMKAYYVSGENSRNWLFRAYVTDTLVMETPLLKVISLGNDQKGNDSDTGVIQDYAGNLLMQPANFKGIHTDELGNDPALMDSTIDWATLAIDNTKPIIGYHYEADGATNQLYLKNGKVRIDANDPAVKIPHLEPDLPQRGTERPSRGIYRPSNMTGASSPSVGLVYYWWSQNPNDPLAGKENDQFAAIKRYSLSAKQPAEELYPGEYPDLQLQVNNNKTNMIAPPAEALTAENSGEWYLHTWTADMTWDTARELMQYAKMKDYVAANPSQYEAWKAEQPNASEAEQIFYANNKALAAVGQYGDTSVWDLSDFKQEDSNWAYNVATLRLDNKPPTVTVHEVNGDQTVNVQVRATVTDEHSGVKQVFYQWVKEGSQPSEIEWRQAVLAGGEATFVTLNNVFEDGTYQLYFKSTDKAGNEEITSLEAPVTVDSKQQVQGTFLTDSNPDYAQSHAVRFSLSGLTPDLVAYAISGNASRPSEGSYRALDALADDPGAYLIEADPTLNGIQYVHMMAREGERKYFYSKAYYFDNEAPSVTFSKQGVAYPLDSQEVTVTVTEPYSTQGVTAQYLWVRAGEPEPTDQSAGWTALPEDKVAVINGTVLLPGEVADFKLYVLAKDGAGNSAISSTSETFKVSRAGGSDTPPADAESDLIYLYGDDQDGYTAVMKLSLATEDKRGYEFSLSPDFGESWGKWRPYTNFAALKVPSAKVADQQIMIKYRTPGGQTSEPAGLTISTLSEQEPIYAIATLHTTRPVNPNRGVDIELALPLGIKAVAAEVNPAPLKRKGNTFTVKENGYYAFDLTDTADANRPQETLYVVVNNIDGIAPLGSIEYSVTEPTSSNVNVKLGTSEPVTITNNQGRNVYTFTGNGTFTFEFKDEAGNTNTATATVSNIDKEGPQVKIVRSYTYGSTGSQTFGTVTDDRGNILLSSGLTLEVQKADGATKDFIMLKGEPLVTVRENGLVTFMVADRKGNTATITEEVNNIAGLAPTPEQVSYTFVDDTGVELAPDSIVTIDGQKYAKGAVKVTLSGKTTAPNKVFAGSVPVVKDDEYTNLISNADGTFSYSKVFSVEGSTLIALSDLVGNVNKVAVTVKGLDNMGPELTLNLPTTAIVQNKANFDFRTDLGGYTVTDNVSAPENIKVEVKGPKLEQTGRQLVTYTATDQVGNVTKVVQEVFVVSDQGMLIFGNDRLISAGLGESVLFDTSSITFRISRFNVMDVGGKQLTNEQATFDLLYQPGLYREGQMKYIAQKLTYEELVSGKFTVTFPQAGWYTLIVRNQEREREYATFFITKTK